MNPLYKDLIQELPAYMQTLGLGAVGTDIFVGELPQGIVKGYFLVESPGPAPEKYLDHEYQVIDIWYRSPYAGEAIGKMREVYTNMHRRYSYNTDNWHVFFSEALSNVQDFDRDLENGKLLRLSVQFMCRNLNSIS